MPYTAHYVDAGKGVHKFGSGTVTGLEIFVSAIEESRDQERARKLRYGLIDFSAVTEFKVTQRAALCDVATLAHAVRRSRLDVPCLPYPPGCRGVAPETSGPS